MTSTPPSADATRMTHPFDLPVGLSTWPVTVPADRLVAVHREAVPPPAAGPRELVLRALERPFGFEPLRRALTPDDLITLVLDAALPKVAELVAGVLEHLGSAGIPPERVTILTPPRGGPAPDPDVPAPVLFEDGWVDDLPDEFADVKTEVHDPADRKRLSYLATTKGGRRLYLNRTLVEADFTVVLTGRGYDPATGYGGGESFLFPALSDEETRAALAGTYSANAPDPDEPNPLRAEATEVTWLLGLPFFVQVIEGPGDTVAEVVAGLPGSAAEGVRRLDARWRGTVPRKADTVIATVSGNPRRPSFLALAKAAACAARVVKKGGRIALLAEAAPVLGETADRLRGADDPGDAAREIVKAKPADGAAALLWTAAARRASLFVASGYPDDFAEELFATPVRKASEVQRLIDAGGDVIVIPDADKSVVTVERGAE